jgi:lysophospholipase L1-like esterase
MKGTKMLKISRRATAIASSVAAAIAAAVLTAGTASATPAPPLVGTWAASPVAGATSGSCPAGSGGLANQTVRNIVYPSVSGSAVRVRFSNVFGTSPLTIGSASVAVAGSGANVVPGTVTQLTFGGKTSFTVPPGAEVLSDPASITVTRQQDLAVSVYVPQFSGPATFHPLAVATNYLSATGDFTGATTSANYPTSISCWMFVDGVDVVPSAQVAGSVIAFGDSITDGANSTTNANDRWPNYLARRFDALHGRTMSVVDEGISGNRVLSDAGTAGVSAEARFNRDVLAQPGAKDVIVLEGINDIGQSDLGTTPLVTADDLINAYKQLIAQAHAAGLKIFGATLTPFEGAFYWSPAGEATREAVNHWILTSGAFDGVIDFASATADPANPEMYNPAYDSGDHLHPNDAGYQAMANAINLAMLLHS